MKKKESILGKLRQLGINEILEFPAARSSYVKSACTTFGFEWGKKFATHNIRERNIVQVKRIE